MIPRDEIMNKDLEKRLVQLKTNKNFLMESASQRIHGLAYSAIRFIDKNDTYNIAVVLGMLEEIMEYAEEIETIANELRIKEIG